VISKNITNCAKLYVCRWDHHTGTIQDIVKTVRQVKKILNIILGQLFGPIGALILGWIFGGGTSVADQNMSFYKNPCDIHLKYVFLTEFGL